MNSDTNRSTDKGLRSTLTGILVSLVLAIGKAVAGIFGHSFALIADAVESAGDLFTSSVMYLGLKKAAKPPDDKHPYGHGKAEPIAAFFVVISLILAALFISIESVQNLSTRHEPPEWWTLLVLAVVIVVKESLSRFMNIVGTDIQSTAIRADALHHRSDAITSAAAFIGISIALVGGEGYEIADDYAALFASIVIVFNAWNIARTALGELMDEQMPRQWIDTVSDTAMSHPMVHSIEKVRMRKVGLEYHLDFHLRVPFDLTVEEGHRIAHEVKSQIEDLHFPFQEVLIHLEPSPKQK